MLVDSIQSILLFFSGVLVVMVFGVCGRELHNPMDQTLEPTLPPPPKHKDFTLFQR